MFIMGLGYVPYGTWLCSLRVMGLGYVHYMPWDWLCSLHAMELGFVHYGTGLCSLWDWVMFFMGLAYVNYVPGDWVMFFMCHGTRLCSLCAMVLGGLCSLCAMRLTRKILHLQYVQLEGYSCHLQFSSLQPMFNVYKWSKQNT